nr:hypothetical protein [uncultured Mucilaginibacter sp.]
MKFLAVLLLCCIVFLSAFSGIDKPAQLKANKTCCKRMPGKMGCHNKKAKKDNGCTKPGCAAMLSCSICGFFTEQPLTLQPGYLPFSPKTVALYKIGKLSAYHKADWKPPKAC